MHGESVRFKALTRNGFAAKPAHNGRPRAVCEMGRQRPICQGPLSLAAPMAVWTSHPQPIEDLSQHARGLEYLIGAHLCHGGRVIERGCCGIMGMGKWALQGTCVEETLFTEHMLARTDADGVTQDAQADGAADLGQQRVEEQRRIVATVARGQQLILVYLCARRHR
jgi:hypothetical protein